MYDRESYILSGKIFDLEHELIEKKNSVIVKIQEESRCIVDYVIIESMYAMGMFSKRVESLIEVDIRRVMVIVLDLDELKLRIKN